MYSTLLARAAVALVFAILVLPGGILGDAAASHVGRSAAAPSQTHVEKASVPLASVPGAGPVPPGVERMRSLDHLLLARGVPGWVIHPPNYAAATPGRVGPVQPRFTQAPAPMGISDVGLENSSGKLVPYNYTTSSVWGSIDLTRADPAYLDGDGPDTFTVQLNAVATNVTLFGVPGYQFWTQDFFVYTASTHTLTFGDNVWNFSSVSGVMPSNVFASYGPNGSPQPPVYYYAVGPTFNVSYPFTANLYLNASRVGGLPAVFFNYSLTNASGSIGSGTFDYVAFNATAGPGTGPIPLPVFQVNGSGLDPTGLPNDLEFVLVGDGNGDTTTFFAINATMALRERDATKGVYVVVRAAFNAGSDTGETSDGVMPVYRVPTHGGPPTVTLVTGPSFVEGLWNVSTAVEGARLFHAVQRPQNAFLFVSPGSTFNASAAQWVPTLRFGTLSSVFSLPNSGTYTLEWMLSDRTPLTDLVTDLPVVPNGSILFAPANSSTTFFANLTVDTSTGSYTPLLAWGNAELGAISQSGNGSAENPYVLIHRPGGILNPVFGELNDWAYPTFWGVLLINTSSYVDVIQPSVAIEYGSWMAGQLSGLGLPSSNSLQLEFWNVSNVAVVNSTDLSGWVSADFTPFPDSEVLLWGSSGNLVAGNTFHDQGLALMLYGGTHNTVWGNTIVPSSQMPSFFDDNNTTGLLEWESGDLIYNNYFDVLNPAVTPDFDLFSCENICLAASYNDTWNVSLRPANASATVLGQMLTGSILGTWYQGGNYWSNYGTASDPFGQLPYNDQGQITQGGDYLPLVLTTVYAVAFEENGLPAGAAWNVTLFGVTGSSSTSSIVLGAPNGTYNVTVGAPPGYVGPSNLSVVVNGSNLSVPVNFSEVFLITVHESGLVTGWAWNATFRGTSAGARTEAFSTNGSSGTVELVNGTYTCGAAAYGYVASPAPAKLTVRGHARSLTIDFVLTPVLSVTATGLAPGAPWTVTVTQGKTHVNETGLGDGTLVFTVLEINPGAFHWNVTVAGYSASPGSGNGTASRPGATPATTTANVTFTANPAPAAAFDWLWAAVAAAAALAALGFGLYVAERRRGRKPPTPIVPAASVVPAGAATVPPATPWDESSPEKGEVPAGPPWAEVPTDTERPQPYERRPGGG